jgi:hypothetical protein
MPKRRERQRASVTGTLPMRPCQAHFAALPGARAFFKRVDQVRLGGVGVERPRSPPPDRAARVKSEIVGSVAQCERIASTT